MNVLLVFAWGLVTVLHLINPPDNPPLPIWMYTALLCLTNVAAAMDNHLKHQYRKALGLDA